MLWALGNRVRFNFLGVPLRMEVLTPLAVRTIPLIWAQLSTTFLQIFVKCWTIPPARIIRRAKFVINKGVHQASLIYHFLPFRALWHQVSEVIIGDNDAITVYSMLNDIPVIIAVYFFPILYFPTWSPNQNSSLL